MTLKGNGRFWTTKAQTLQASRGPRKKVIGDHCLLDPWYLPRRRAWSSLALASTKRRALGRFDGLGARALVSEKKRPATQPAETMTEWSIRRVLCHSRDQLPLSRFVRTSRQLCSESGVRPCQCSRRVSRLIKARGTENNTLYLHVTDLDPLQSVR
jgi:hypothetical protein